MDVLWTLLSAVAELVVLFALLHLAFVVGYYLRNVKVPHGVCGPWNLKFLAFLIIWVVSMDYIFKKIGIIKTDFALANFILDTPLFVSKDPSLSICNTHIEGVPVRFYRPKPHRLLQRGVLFIHGGGGTTGSIASYDPLCRYLSKESDSVILSIGYSLVPYQPYPVQYYQCLDVAIHFMKHAEEYGVDSSRVIIWGDSFGGLVAASVSQMLIQKDGAPKLCAQVLVYPFLQSVKHSLPSYMQNLNSPPLGKIGLVTLALKYIQKDVSLLEVILQGAHVSKEVKAKYDKWLSKENLPEEFRGRETKARTSRGFSFGSMEELVDQLCGPLLSPLLVEDAIIRRLPDTFIMTCQFDALRDDGVLYKKRLEDNGVPVTWCHLEDGFHGFLNFIINTPFAFSICKEGADNMVNYIRRF